MKTMLMGVVKTGGMKNTVDTSYIADVNDKSYLHGYHIPAHAKNIISHNVEDVEIMETGDRVLCELHRYSSDDDSVITGGHWESKIGTVNQLFDDNSVLVCFDDGDVQIMSGIRGSHGYPGKNIQLVLEIL